MATPKKKVSKSRRNMRRSHHALMIFRSIVCSNCGDLKRPHHLCVSCGYYKNRCVVNINVGSKPVKAKSSV